MTTSPVLDAGAVLGETSEWWQVALSVIAGLVLVWLVLVLVLWLEQRKHPGRASLTDILRLAPDVVRLLKRLASDPTVPVGVRIWLGVLLVYLISPIDLIPDFVPVLGFADDALVVAIALRFATRRAGSDAVRRHWPGTPAGLAAVLRLAGLPSSSPGR
ncbi:YkvA family protein [Cryobacterium psychrophilum]|uniref:DUF1232 domain-containing protein n=1 Tax=Cryobacterium psychrophilum TaxID=41988 RepID=A0A4Y8KU88_9MICO|nr:DUF1232 domain-containing protein [Cryobacterium psychrophilum]TDW28759.1 uncharacterized protein DUF1232 [Cryobacterium psychrophilum]TFD82413.1 DUF1232 domain-containing protein [Cryobacterium psychrophilum]